MGTPNTEEVLKYVHKTYVNVNADDVNLANKDLRIILDTVTSAMKHEEPFFEELFETYFYGGSSYDGLKVGKPDEFDIDLKLYLPNILKIEVIPSEKDGFVYIHLKDWDALKKSPLWNRFSGLKNLIDDDKFLSQVKIKSWMESTVQKALNQIKKDGTLLDIKLSTVKSGPAITLRATTVDGRKISIDLVAVFRIPGKDHWNKLLPIRQNDSTVDDFLVVPKPPKQAKFSLEKYWRLSFPEQEREFMRGLNRCKDVIRFLKKLRDTHTNIYVPSYFIKTIFLWEIEKKNRKFWEKPLEEIFIEMLKVYKTYFEKHEIPYFWSKDNNLIELNVDIDIVNNINYLQNIIKKITAEQETNSFIIAKYLLPRDEYEQVRYHFMSSNSDAFAHFDFQSRSSFSNYRNNDFSDSDSDGENNFETSRNTTITRTEEISNEAAGLAMGAVAVVGLGAAIYGLFSWARSHRNNSNN